MGPLMVVALTGSAILAGLTVALFGISRFLVAYPVGKITDTRGRKPGIQESANAVGCGFLGGSICRGCGGVIWPAGATVAVGPCEPPDRALAAAATTIIAAAEPTHRILRWVLRSMSYIEALMTLNSHAAVTSPGRCCPLCADFLKKKLRRCLSGYP
jgi:MFS family permease